MQGSWGRRSGIPDEIFWRREFCALTSEGFGGFTREATKAMIKVQVERKMDEHGGTEMETRIF